MLSWGPQSPALLAKRPSGSHVPAAKGTQRVCWRTGRGRAAWGCAQDACSDAFQDSLILQESSVCPVTHQIFFSTCCTERLLFSSLKHKLLMAFKLARRLARRAQKSQCERKLQEGLPQGFQVHGSKTWDDEPFRAFNSNKRLCMTHKPQIHHHCSRPIWTHTRNRFTVI